MIRAALLLSPLPHDGVRATERRFTLRDPLTRDTDLRPVTVRVPPGADAEGPAATSRCAPEVYVSPLIWDGVDNMLFRPLSEAVGIGRARRGRQRQQPRRGRPTRPGSPTASASAPSALEELDARRVRSGAACSTATTRPTAPGSSTRARPTARRRGFRVNIPGKGKYLFKVDDRAARSARARASVIGAAAYDAVGLLHVVRADRRTSGRRC